MWGLAHSRCAGLHAGHVLQHAMCSLSRHAGPVDNDASVGAGGLCNIVISQNSASQHGIQQAALLHRWDPGWVVLGGASTTFWNLHGYHKGRASTGLALQTWQALLVCMPLNL